MTEVLILAAGSVKEKLHFIRYCFDSPALVPINVRSIASYVLDFYLTLCDVRINLVINENDYSDVRKELAYYEDKINYIPVSQTEGVVETLKKGLLELRCKMGDVVVNLVTTIPTEFPESRTVFISNKLQKSASWSSVMVTGDKVDFYLKDRVKGEVESYAFTGIFRSSWENLYTLVTEEKLYVKDLMSVVQALHRKHAMKFEFIHWLDCGHELNYYETRMKLIVSRFFNNISIDRSLGVITKSSKNVEKFFNEINYVHMLPKELSVFYPRILSEIRVENDQAFVDMEYYPYPTVSEYMLYWKLDECHWKRLFDALKSVLQKNNKYTYSIGKKAYLSFYFDKSILRIEEFKKQMESTHPQFFNSNYLIVNGQQCKNFEHIKSDVFKKIEEMYRENDFSIMHGDFCFNNMLYDQNSGILRLIDARGSFGDSCVGIYGDIKYDLSKITHSVMGSYDYIVNHKFTLKELSAVEFNYSINHRPWHNFLCKLNEQLITDMGYNVNEIIFIVGLLFVSMCPLHNDDQTKQKMMYLHGIYLLNSILSKDAGSKDVR